MRSLIPVFVSVPSSLSDEQQQSFDFIIAALADEQLEYRALGRSEYPVDTPLNEVFTIARHCSGGVILGYTQFKAHDVIVKPDTSDTRHERSMVFPTPWNNLEAGILFALRVPLLVFREPGIAGGIFDLGVDDIFIQSLPVGAPRGESCDVIRAVIRKWAVKVQAHYRQY